MFMSLITNVTNGTSMHSIHQISTNLEFHSVQYWNFHDYVIKHLWLILWVIAELNY